MEEGTDVLDESHAVGAPEASKESVGELDHLDLGLDGEVGGDGREQGVVIGVQLLYGQILQDLLGHPDEDASLFDALLVCHLDFLEELGADHGFADMVAVLVDLEEHLHAHLQDEGVL